MLILTQAAHQVATQSLIQVNSLLEYGGKEVASHLGNAVSIAIVLGAVSGVIISVSKVIDAIAKIFRSLRK